VRERIVTELQDLPEVEIRIFDPIGAPAAKEMVKNRKVPKMTPGRAAMVELMRRYLDGLLDPFVTLLEIHKLMYFMQAAGQELNLKYSKGPYGPYAREIGLALNHTEGHLTSGYADGGDDPAKQISLVPGAVEDALNFLASEPETRERFERVAALTEGFESPYGLELLSTVHWVMTREGASTLDETVSLVHGWNDRKRQFTRRQIEIAMNALRGGNWVSEAS
jgi:O-acetyl-ADP-ribose deacetylase (regulator of RNase III)